LAVLAQRLVRKVCSNCSNERVFTESERSQLGLSREAVNLSYRGGTGCPSCRNTGYRGRIAISELLIVDEAIRKRIQDRASATEIRDAALANGMRLLRDDGIDKILTGVTTPSEVARVTLRTEI
jgi:type II secretory ATPase GspE/PulE/Tfp pilus assembly ATPase PilB-like protein